MVYPWFFLTVYFVLRYSQLTNNVIVSGKQQRDSAINIHGSILPQTPQPSRLPHNTEQNSMCYTLVTGIGIGISLLVIHFKYSSVYMSIPNSLTIPSAHPLPQQP